MIKLVGHVTGRDYFDWHKRREENNIKTEQNVREWTRRVWGPDAGSLADDN